jgi:glycosyltransferase involved in cell wall biosynthesis
MRIAVFHELPEGGGLNSLREWGTQLKKKHTVDLFTIKTEHNSKEKSHFTSIHKFPFHEKIWKGKNWKIRLYKDTLELYKLNKLHKIIASKIDGGSYDLVLVNASKYTQAPFILRHLKTKSFFYCHDPNLRIVYEKILELPRSIGIGRYYYGQVARYIRKQIDKKNFMSADVILANSKFVQRRVKKTYGRNSTVVYYGVNTTVFKPTKAEKKFDIIFVGSYESVDGYQILDEALKLVPKKVVVRVLGFHTEWISTPQGMSKIYNNSRIAVCLTYNEPFGMVPIEAMACKLPVIAANDGGYPESVEHGRTGFLLKRDPKILAKKIQLLLSDAKIYEEFSNNSLELVRRKWTWKASTTKLLEAFSANYEG